MSLRGRLDRLERGQAASGNCCPGCGGDRRMAIFTDRVDAEGRTWLEDAQGNLLPDLPSGPSCDLCRHEIRFLVVTCHKGRTQRGGGEAMNL